VGVVTPEQRRALVDLARIWAGHRLYVVGAMALVLVRRLPAERVTQDVDLAIDVAVGELKQRMDSAGGWDSVPGIEQRWRHREGAVVDLIAIGERHLAGGILEWPETGMQMNLTGFELLATSSVRLVDVGLVGIEVPPAALIALLKMSAWLDRPEERRRDLRDLAWLFDHYVDPADDRLFVGEAAELGVFDRDASTYLLGLDIGRVAEGSARGVVERFLERLGGHVPSQIALAQRWATVADEEEAVVRLGWLERGLADAASE